MFLGKSNVMLRFDMRVRQCKRWSLGSSGVLYTGLEHSWDMGQNVDDDFRNADR